METVERYRRIVVQVLEEFAGPPDPTGAVRTEIIADHERGHYQLMDVGWQDERRVYGCYIHVDLIEGKVWIQHDGIEGSIVPRLLELGIPKDNIVLGFQMPFKRKFSGFATG